MKGTIIEVKGKDFMEGYNDGVLEERQRLKEEINELRHFYFLDGIRFLKKAEVLALLDNHEKSLSEGLSDTPQTSSKLPKTNLNGESRKGNRGLSKLKKVKVMEKK